MFKRRIIEHLVNWKNKKQRKPLVLRGARQVGKTSAALLFARKYFDDTVTINLENSDHRRMFREDISLADFKKIVEIKFKQKLVPGKTLLFLDEIQNAPSLIKLLRFFYEEMPELHVMSAGSLMEVMLEKEGFSFPVGRVESAFMYPLDFFEFLEAKGEGKLLEFLSAFSMGDKTPEALHIEAMKQFYEYTMIGGMPEAVSSYLENGDLAALKAIYAALISGYVEDVHKYSSLAASKYLSFIIDQAPLFAGSCITYEKFGGSRFRSREMSQAFTTLEKTMLVYQAQATKSVEVPLLAQPKRAKKILYLDVGLVNHRMGIQEEFVDLKDMNNFYRGRVAEQVVGQNMLAQSVEEIPRIFYWARDKAEGAAEIDFCLSRGGKLTAVEVKSGTANNLKSLFSFARQVKRHVLVRVYGGVLKEEAIKIDNKAFRIISIPFYLAPRLLKIQ